MIDAGAIAEYAETGIRTVMSGRTEIAVIRWRGDRFYAVRNVCPHQGAALCFGARLGPMLVSDMRDMRALEADYDRPTIACAWHGWEFELATGEAVARDPRYKLKTFPVTLRDGRVYVDVAGDGR